MGMWRDTLRAARARVHQTMRVPAVYMLRADAEGTKVWVRPRYRKVEVGVDEGTSGLPRIIDTADRILFDMTEVASPMRNAFVVMGADEAYVVTTLEPSRLGYVEANVTRLPDAKAAALWAAGKPADFEDD